MKLFDYLYVAINAAQNFDTSILQEWNDGWKSLAAEYIEIGLPSGWKLRFIPPTQKDTK